MRPPCLGVCVSALPHASPYDTDFPQMSCALTGKVKGEGARFFFWLWKMEASFMTHVPCPPVKITPAIFQRCSIIGCTANENNGACGEETRQTKKGEKKIFLDGNTCRSTLYIYIILSRPIRPLTSSHTSEKFSWVFSGNPTWQSSKTLCRHFVLQRRVFWVKPNKDASLHGPTTCGWITGHSFVIPYYEGKAARLLCLRPNCDCQTLELCKERWGGCMFVLSLEDERAGNAKVAVL